MATIDLGKIKQVWRGTYSSSNTYTADDLVEYTDNGVTSTYIAVATSSFSNQAPSTSGTVNSSYWAFVAKGVANPIPVQSGNAGKALVTDGSNVSWGIAGKVIATSQFTYSTRSTLGASTGRAVMYQNSFTKQRANSKFRIHLIFPLGGSGDTYPHFGSTFIRFSTTNYTNDGSDMFGYIHNTRATSNNMGAVLIGNFLYDTTGTNISGTGAVYLQIGYHSATSSSSLRPAPIWNPNASEDNRSRQTITNILIEELA